MVSSVWYVSSMWYFLLFYGQVIFHCMAISYFVYPSIVNEFSGFSYFLTFRNDAAMNIHIKVLCTHVFHFSWVCT